MPQDGNLGNDWGAMGNMVLNELKNLNKNLSALEKKFDDVIVEQAVLKTKVALYSAAVAGTTSLAFLLIEKFI